MILAHMVAAATNNVIGKDNDLPWHLPEDLKFFKEKTTGRSMIMGRKTFESIGKALPNRFTVVVTRQKNYLAEGAEVVGSVAEAIELCKSKVNKYGDEIFIVGGGQIFKDTMNMVDIIYLTRIHRDVDGDIFYPDVNPLNFQEVERRDRNEPEAFSFLTYQRKK